MCIFICVARISITTLDRLEQNNQGFPNSRVSYFPIEAGCIIDICVLKNNISETKPFKYITGLRLPPKTGCMSDPRSIRKVKLIIKR